MGKTPYQPPRFVPIVTQVVPHSTPAPAPPVAAIAPVAPMTPVAPVTAAPIETPPQISDGFEELLVHRLMQRVDMALDQRLRDAIATVVQEQTRSVLPRLREEVESVVRQVVYEAVADELASKDGVRQ